MDRPVITYRQNPAITYEEAAQYWQAYAQLHGEEFATFETVETLERKQLAYINRKKREQKKPQTERDIAEYNLNKRIRYFANKEHKRLNISQPRAKYFKENKEDITKRYWQHVEAKEQRKQLRQKGIR